MTDIVERLRDPAVFVDRNEVADEIERLRAALKDIAKQEKADERETEGDIESGFDAIVDVARAALRGQ